jgi:transcriptional regulator with XRE-family HTH domain
MVDPERMAAARKSAMLERIELAHLSQALDLAKLAAAHDVKPGDQVQVLEHPGQAVQTLRTMLTAAGVDLSKPGLRIGVSRDEIAKLETGGRKRPKITTLRKLIDALNYARTERGKPNLDIEDLQVPGEVLIPEARDGEPVRDILAREAEEAEAIAAYQEASNDIYYATEGGKQEGE